MSIYEQQSTIPTKLNAILATTAKCLAAKEQVKALSILVNAQAEINWSSHDNWDGGQDYWTLDLYVPVEVYYAIDNINQIQGAITEALSLVMTALSHSDFMECCIHTHVEEDPDWRSKSKLFLSGLGISNQGRVRSDNIATRQHDGLLFRSKQEVNFYNALKRESVPFAPLAVVLKGGIEYRRVEPDFVIFKDGMVMIVEIDGDLFHTEKPVEAHARLKFLMDEGTELERIPAHSCDTPEKAREAVALVLQTIEKRRRAS